jgi:hypothetical protein
MQCKAGVAEAVDVQTQGLHGVFYRPESSLSRSQALKGFPDMAAEGQ